ncbi:MAG: DUF202 domain-containing protein [Syntrophobacteraceae bacterium]|nr:DUF202 domain-containing protein [Syntrophobacteraceae bacterium]
MTESNEETIKEPSSNQLALERTILAHERTLMGWVRTSTSLITFGFTLYKFFSWNWRLNLHVIHLMMS